MRRGLVKFLPRDLEHFKDFYSCIPFKVFLIWAKLPRGGGDLGHAIKFEARFFQDFYQFRLSKSAENFSNVCNIFRGQQY